MATCWLISANASRACLRSGKVDVAEVLVLSAALDIPPVLLLFPGFSMDGFRDALPGVLTPDDEAVRWVSGRVSFPRKLGSQRSTRSRSPSATVSRRPKPTNGNRRKHR